MSIIGLAASPGTDVEPTCAMCRTRSPRARMIFSAWRRKRDGQSALYSTNWTGPFSGFNPPMVTFLLCSSSISVRFLDGQNNPNTSTHSTQAKAQTDNRNSLAVFGTLPYVAHVRLLFFISCSVGFLDQLEAMAFIKIPSLLIF